MNDDQGSCGGVGPSWGPHGEENGGVVRRGESEQAHARGEKKPRPGNESSPPGALPSPVPSFQPNPRPVHRHNPRGWVFVSAAPGRAVIRLGRMRQGSNEATATCRAGAATVCQECGGQKAVTGLLTLTPSFAVRVQSSWRGRHWAQVDTCTAKGRWMR